MQSLAILLTVFNRKAKTLQCLQNLYAQFPIEGYTVDVYLTDDGCTDGTPETVKEQFPDVNILHADGNLFWNRGMYRAWSRAAETNDYDFYMWLNDDTTIYPDALSVLLQTSNAYKDKCIIVGTTCAVGNQAIITYGGRTEKKGLMHPSDKTQQCDFFNGNIVLFPKSVLEKVGMNDYRFRHALGDFDYGMRARKLGVQSVVAPGILGECDEHDSLPVWCNPKKPFNKRWKAFRSPLGHNPEEFFIYENRHHGIAMACFHYFTNHLRVVCPWIWKGR